MTERAPERPGRRPRDPRFASGPTKKRPGWSVAALEGATLGRYHRSVVGKAKLAEAIDRTRALLQPPDDYEIAIVPASDTGAMEMAMWTMLGPRPVDLFAWEVFGQEWASDAKALGLDVEVHTAPSFGQLPDLTRARKDADIVFTQNGTTSGVRIPDFDWIPADREGLAINDATSALFAQPVDWAKCDVVTFSWQKVLGGEAAHGMLIVSPRAMERLKSYRPARPVPKIFRLAKNGVVDKGLFEGATINTPSLLATEDYLDALSWGERIGGLQALRARADANAQAVERFVAGAPWAAFLAEDPRTRSNTSVCLKIVDPRVASLPEADRRRFAERVAALLDEEGVAFDIAAHRSAPPGLRIWCGATVDYEDVDALGPWLDWAFATAIAELVEDAA